MSDLKVTDFNHSAFNELLHDNSVMAHVKNRASEIQGRLSFSTEVETKNLKSRGAVYVGTDSKKVVYNHDRIQELIRAVGSKLK